MKKNIGIVLLAICVLGLSSFIVYDKVLKDDNTIKTENKKEETKEVGTNKEYETISFDEKEANEKMSLTALAMIYKGLDDSMLNKEYLTEENKLDFAWYSADVEPVLYDFSVAYGSDRETGAFPEVTGAKAVGYDAFAKYYETLFGEKLDKSQFPDYNKALDTGEDFGDNRYKIYIYNGMLFGSYPTGGVFPANFELNVDEVKKSNNNYKVLVDIYTYDADKEEELNKVINSDFSELEDEVKYQFDIEITMHDDETYTINSFKLVNKK